MASGYLRILDLGTKLNLAKIVREAWLSALSQRVSSLLSIVMVGGMAAAILLTTGQTAAAERAALAQIDAIGTRSIIVRAGEHAGLDTTILQRLAAFDGIESVTAFGTIVDARNALVPGAPLTGLRPAYGTLVSGAQAGTVLASSTASLHLGLFDGTGAIVTNDGFQMVVTGHLEVPEHLGFLEPLAVIVPDSTEEVNSANGQPITTLVILATEPRLVSQVTRALTGVLAVPEPQEISLETSSQLASLHAAVSGQLGIHGRNTLLSILGVAAALVASNLFGLVQMRRKDYGRRRALGASQILIVTLLTTQTTILSAIGAVCGAAIATITSWYFGHPLPGLPFTLAVIVAGILVSILASIIPAIAAARRDPLHELRIA